MEMNKWMIDEADGDEQMDGWMDEELFEHALYPLLPERRSEHRWQQGAK